MLVKFGYCRICDNGPDKQNRHWVQDLVQGQIIATSILRECTSCGTTPPNKNLLYIEVKVAQLGKEYE